MRITAMNRRLSFFLVFLLFVIVSLSACDESSSESEGNTTDGDESDGDTADDDDNDDQDEAWPETAYLADWPYPVIRAQGTELVDEHGRTAMLRGINAGGRAKLPPFIPWQGSPQDASFEDDLNAYMDFPHDWGMNVLRLTVFWEAVEPVRGTYDQAYLDLLADKMTAAQNRGLYVFLDFHQDLFSRYLGGSGAPAWTLENPPEEPPALDDTSWFMNVFTNAVVLAAFDRFWSNEDNLQDAYVAMVRTVTVRLKDFPNLLGVDVMNEPNPGANGSGDMNAWYSETLIPFYKSVAEAVRQELPRAVIFVEPSGLEAGQGSSEQTWTLAGLENAVISPHYYYPIQFILGEYDGNIDELRVALADRQALAELGAPVLLSEFGFRGSESDPGDDENAAWFIRDFYTALDELSMHATIWTHEVSTDELWNHEDCSFVNGDWSERVPRADAVARPYPEFVNGTITQFGYDEETKTVTLGYTVSGDLSLPTVLRIPPRHLSQAEPVAEMTFGKGRWIADKGVWLLYETLGEAKAAAGDVQTVTLRL